MKPILLFVASALLLSGCAKDSERETPLSPTEIANQVWVGIGDHTYEEYFISESELVSLEIDATWARTLLETSEKLKEKLRKEIDRRTPTSAKEPVIKESSIDLPIELNGRAANLNTHRVLYMFMENIEGEVSYAVLDYIFLQLESGHWKILELRLERNEL